MSFFSKTQYVVWPQTKSLTVYSDQKDNNSVSFDVNLFKQQTDADLQSLAFYFRKNHIHHVYLLLPDSFVSTRSFVYDSKIEQIDKKEVIGLAKNFASFNIKPQSLSYNLIQTDSNTIIQATFYRSLKIKNLLNNLAKLGVKVDKADSVSRSIANLMGNFYTEDYFVIYPLSENLHSLVLAKGSQAYLTSQLKGSSLDLQKLINYSKLYFQKPTQKVFLPSQKLDVQANQELNQTQYDSAQIAADHHQPTNLPLPVLAILLSSAPGIAIMNQQPMPNQVSSPSSNPPKSGKSILPLVAVFILTAAIASITIWYFLNRDSSGIATPAPDVSPTTIPEATPTQAPTPTIVPVSKDIPLQVLNATSINGQAASLKQTLTDLGFTDIAVGNSNRDLTANVIQVKPSQEASLSAYFSSELATSFPATIDATLDEDSKYDAVFLIGTDLRQTPTSASSPTPTETEEAEPTPEE